MARSTMLFILTVIFAATAHFADNSNPANSLLVAAVFFGSGCICRSIEVLQPSGRWRQ